MSIERILATGDETELLDFNNLIAPWANFIERRGQTCFFTVIGNHIEDVLESAKLVGVTLQKRAEKEPFWPVVVQGKAKAWDAAMKYKEGL